MSNRIMVISAHPDDETLGCGGTILRHVTAGDEVHWVIVTKAHCPMWRIEVIDQKNIEIEAVQEAYGFESVDNLGYSSGLLETVPLGHLIDDLKESIRHTKPQTIYTVGPHDVHTDHAVVWKTLSVVLKPMHTARHGVRRILTYEIPSSTDQAAGGSMFRPQFYRDISTHLERKLQILNIYGTESQAEPLPRSASAVRAWARMRGATIGVQYAEAFEVVRWVE